MWRDCCHRSGSGRATCRGCRNVLVASPGRLLGDPEASGRCARRSAGEDRRRGPRLRRFLLFSVHRHQRLTSGRWRNRARQGAEARRSISWPPEGGRAPSPEHARDAGDAGVQQGRAGRAGRASDSDPLDLFKRDFVARSVVELGRPRAFVRRHRLGVFERAGGLQVGGYSRSSERVTPDQNRQTSFQGTALNHAVGVHPVHRP